VTEILVVDTHDDKLSSMLEWLWCCYCEGCERDTQSVL
jgi:hypothetical protein